MWERGREGERERGREVERERGREGERERGREGEGEGEGEGERENLKGVERVEKNAKWGLIGRRIGRTQSERNTIENKKRVN